MFRVKVLERKDLNVNNSSNRNDAAVLLAVMLMLLSKYVKYFY